jgi:hypothetical protein
MMNVSTSTKLVVSLLAVAALVATRLSSSNVSFDGMRVTVIFFDNDPLFRRTRVSPFLL